MNEVLRFFVNLFERLPNCFLGRCWSCRCCRTRPPVCFLMVFETVFFKACFVSETTSTSSGTPCFKRSVPIRFAVGRKKRRANGKATRPIASSKAPNPLSLCL